MREETHPTIEGALQQNGRRPSFWLRVSLWVALGLAAAVAIAVGSSDSPYEDRLVELALLESHGYRGTGAAANSSALNALLLDYDDELAFKAQLAIDKYGDDARDVLLRFGDGPSFQEALRQYGENTLPVVAYFVQNDIASLRLSYLAQQKSEAAIAAAKAAWARFWGKEDGSDRPGDTVADVYGPELRGQRAIAMIVQEGHPFLGQFVVDTRGKAAWVQTERTAEALKSLFLSGAINLEKKYRSGTPLEAADVFGAGLDAFVIVGAFKALKLLRAAQQARKVGLMQRTRLLGAPLLGRSALGRYAMKYGLAAGTVYLVVRHPSLLSGVFVTLGKSLGIAPLLAKTIGWGLLLAPLFVPMLFFLMLALRVAGALFAAASQALQLTLKRAGWLAPAATRV